MKDITTVRHQVISAFRGLQPPSPEHLICASDARNYASSERTRAAFAGKRWHDLSPEFLQKQSVAFCYLTPRAYRYYLPALLLTALDRFHEGGVHSAVYSLLPSEYAIYYHGADEFFEWRLKAFTPEQIKAVAAFLGLFLYEDSPTTMTFLASRVMRLGWDRADCPESTAFRAFDWKMRHFEWPEPADPAQAQIAREIREAFAETPYPGDNNLSGSVQGDEPSEYALQFRGVDWRTMHPKFLAYNSASLSFLTAEGFRYFLPAYIIAELTDTGIESNADPVFHLTHGFATKRATDSTDWLAYRVERMAGFTHAERKAIIHYLTYVADYIAAEYNANSSEITEINEAIERYWKPSLEG